MRALLLLGLLLLGLHGREITLASYNLHNLFDLNDDQSEYPQYIPNTSWQWNAQTHAIKLEHLSRVIVDMHPDILALQEVESPLALGELQSTIRQHGLDYPYAYFASLSGRKGVSVAILSRYRIQSARSIRVSRSWAYRPILEATIMIHDTPLIVYINHWKAKSGPESMRLTSARVLREWIDQLPSTQPYLILGDLNSDYEEYRTFVRDRKHNDTEGITGLQHVLRTIDERSEHIRYEDLRRCERCLYDPWGEIPLDRRYSHQYRQYNEALDHILIPPALADGKGIEYVRGSFRRFDPAYVFDTDGKIYGWVTTRDYPKHHTGEGYSDHLPIMVRLSMP